MQETGIAFGTFFEIYSSNLTLENFVIKGEQLNSFFNLKETNVSLSNCSFENNYFIDSCNYSFIIDNSGNLDYAMFFAELINFTNNNFGSKGIVFLGQNIIINLNSFQITNNVGISFSFKYMNNPIIHFLESFLMRNNIFSSLNFYDWIFIIFKLDYPFLIFDNLTNCSIIFLNTWTIDANQIFGTGLMLFSDINNENSFDGIYFLNDLNFSNNKCNYKGS